LELTEKIFYGLNHGNIYQDHKYKTQVDSSSGKMGSIGIQLYNKTFNH